MSQLLKYKKQHRIFEYSSVKRISRKQFISSLLQKFTLPVSAFIHGTPEPLFLSYILKSKSFTSSGKKHNDRLDSELLDSCFCTFLYEGYLVNNKISLSFGAQLALGCVISHVGEGEIWS